MFINPGGAGKIYQDLAKDFSAVETPTWSLLLAQSCRSIGYQVSILDANAEKLTPGAVVKRVKQHRPRLICFVVYGQNPNSGTVNMAHTVALAQAIKDDGIVTPISVVGSHVQALPIQVLEQEIAIDIIFCNEGVYALHNLLSKDILDAKELGSVRGIGFRPNSKATLTSPECVVPQERMDIDLPGYAWDLLPYKDSPLDLYRAHFWHAEYDHAKRTPFAAIYTSLGCQFKCDFCMINILNRNDQQEIGVAADYAQMRFWSPEFIIGEFDKLVDMGVKTLRISDEMFLLNRKFYDPLCRLLKERGYGEILRMWSYSRVDTIRRPEDLELIRQAGIKWLCLGIESGDQKVRLEVTKGKFEDIDIREVVRMVHQADIEIIANYIFGLPSDTQASMQKTLDLSLELCTLAWNAYAAMPLPGSQLYRDAIEQNVELPDGYEGYSFHSYSTKPLPTKHLTPQEILRFRDHAFQTYHTYQPFLRKVEQKCGLTARKNIEAMTKIKLKRKILGD